MPAVSTAVTAAGPPRVGQQSSLPWRRSVCQHPPHSTLALWLDVLYCSLRTAPPSCPCIGPAAPVCAEQSPSDTLTVLSRRPFGVACHACGHPRARGQLEARILPGQPAGHRWWGCRSAGRPGAVPSTPHSCLQKLFSGGGRSRPSMARRWTMCFWMTSRQRVCREGTGREEKEAAELAESPARMRAEGCGGDGPRGSPGVPCFRAVVGELALQQEQASSCAGLEPAVRESCCQAAPAGTGARGPRAVKLFPLLGGRSAGQLCAQAMCYRDWCAFVFSGGCRAAPQGLTCPRCAFLSSRSLALLPPAPVPGCRVGACRLGLRCLQRQLLRCL